MTFADATNPDRHELAVVTDKMPTAAVRDRLLPMVRRKTDAAGPGKSTAAEIARGADVSEANLSWYINWKAGEALPFANVPGFERSLEEWMLSQATVQEATVSGFEPFPTPVSDELVSFAKRLRADGGVGVSHGDAGIGKSRALLLLQKEMPRAVVITGTEWDGGKHQIAALLFRRLGLHESRKGGSKMARVARALNGQPRLIVIDNGQRLGSAALKFLFDLHDMSEDPAKKVSVLLVGNPEIVDGLRGNDQFFSRLSSTQDLNAVLSASKGRARVQVVCRQLIAQYIPGAEDVLLPLCATLAGQSGGGRFRSVAKRLAKAAELLRTKEYADKPADAFRGADALLVRRHAESLAE